MQQELIRHWGQRADCAPRFSRLSSHTKHVICSNRGLQGLHVPDIFHTLSLH